MPHQLYWLNISFFGTKTPESLSKSRQGQNKPVAVTLLAGVIIHMYIHTVSNAPQSGTPLRVLPSNHNHPEHTVLCGWLLGGQALVREGLALPPPLLVPAWGKCAWAHGRMRPIRLSS